MSGVTAGALIAVYGATPATFASTGSEEDLRARVGLLQVVEAKASHSSARSMTPFALPSAARGRLVAPGRAMRLRVALASPDEQLEGVLAASPFIELVDAHQAQLVLERMSDGGLALLDDVHGRGDAGEPVLAVVPAARLEATLPMVEHYYRYAMPLHLARMGADVDGALGIALLDCRGAAPAQVQMPDLPGVPAGRSTPFEVAAGDRICFAVRNASRRAMSLALLNCAASGRVQMLGEKRLPGCSSHVFWADEVLGRPFVASLPPHARSAVDRIVALGTDQPDASLRHLVTRQSFEQVLASSAKLRTNSPTPRPPQIDAWHRASAVTAVRIVRSD